LVTRLVRLPQGAPPSLAVCGSRARGCASAHSSREILLAEFCRLAAGCQQATRALAAAAASAFVACSCVPELRVLACAVSAPGCLCRSRRCAWRCQLGPWFTPRAWQRSFGAGCRPSVVSPLSSRASFACRALSIGHRSSGLWRCAVGSWRWRAGVGSAETRSRLIVAHCCSAGLWRRLVRLPRVVRSLATRCRYDVALGAAVALVAAAVCSPLVQLTCGGPSTLFGVWVALLGRAEAQSCRMSRRAS
jgi:hypothetical protein